jgi:hypothetical protein
MYSTLIEQIIQELAYNGIMRKQASIGKLFPTFPARVRAVAAAGGATLTEQLPETWHFKVPSSGKSNNGVDYDVYIRFANLDEMIKKYAPDRRLWNKAGSFVDYRLLASEILNNIDIETDCSCPADLYYGAEYIKTQRTAQYGRQENRPPKIRNPHQYGALCKHGELVFEVLPAYTTTFASFLKRYWSEEVVDAIELSKKELTGIKGGAEELGRKRRERPVHYGRGGKEVPLGAAPEREVPVGEVPEEGEEVATAEPMEGPELGGGPEAPATRTGKRVTKLGTKGANVGTPRSTKPGTKPVGQGNIKATRPNTKRGTK